MEIRSKSEEIIQLARELLDDIELTRLATSSLLLKATRLARLVEADQSFRSFLNWEMAGYQSGNDLASQWMTYLGRWINRAQGTAYWGPLAQIDAAISAAEAELRTLRVPDINIDESIHSANPTQYIPPRNAWVPTPAQAAQTVVNTVTDRVTTASTKIGALVAIRSRVLAMIHQFAANVYHERAFSGMAESVFESYKSRIDPILAEACADVLERIPAVAQRLAEGDAEAVSHALTTCRRIIDAFADAVFPPREGSIDVDGQDVPLNAQNPRARLLAYIRERTQSEHLRKKYRQSLANLYGRVSVGVHDDVSTGEAQSLFVETYLLVGQLLDLGELPRDSLPFTDGIPPATS